MFKTLQQQQNGQALGNRLRWFIAVLLFLHAPLLQGQDEKAVGPFGEPVAPAQPVANPLLKPGSGQPRPLPVQEPLVVRLLRESNPTTPFELTRAVQLMVQTSQLSEKGHSQKSCWTEFHASLCTSCTL